MSSDLAVEETPLVYVNPTVNPTCRLVSPAYVTTTDALLGVEIDRFQ